MPQTYSWQILRAGSFRLDGGGMFGLIPRAIWSTMAEPDDHNRIPLQTNCLLLRPMTPPPISPPLRGGGEPPNAPDPSTSRASTKLPSPMKTDPHAERGANGGYILIETGFGDKWDAKNRAIFDLERRTVVDALREVQVEPEEIDLVIVTHLHFDHAGGVTRRDDHGDAVPTFPSARIVVQRTEWEDALANKSTMTRTYLRENLNPIARQIELIDGEAELSLAPGIHVWPMIGHTWGQHAVRFEDSNGVICFPGDVMPTVNHVGAAFSLAYDMLPYDNMLSKKALLERAHAGNWRIILDHEPGNPVVRVIEDARRPGRFTLETV